MSLEIEKKENIEHKNNQNQNDNQKEDHSLDNFVFEEYSDFHIYKKFFTNEGEFLKYFKDIKEFEHRFFKITSHFSFNFPKPQNLQEEKKHFFEAIKNNKEYNPQIRYTAKFFNEKYVEKLYKLKEEIQNKEFFDLENDNLGIKNLYFERLKSKIFEVECHKYWGLEQSTQYVLKYRGEPSFELLDKAKKYAQNYKRQKVKFDIISYKQVGFELKSYVKEICDDDIEINYDSIQSKVNIAPREKKVNINFEERFTTLDLDRLKVHEIGTHYLRYVNGKNSKFRIFEVGTSNYIETEEGLAAIMEELKGVSSTAQMYIYAGRVIGAYYALRKSFYEVFKILKTYGFKDEDAFAISYRVKRNLCDTSLKGGFTKDYVYFSGYLKIKEYIQKGGDLKALFVGKIKVEDLEILKNIISVREEKLKTIL